MNKKFTFLSRPSGGDGHRYFSVSDDDRIAVADNSGYHPGLTDDGPLYIDVQTGYVRIITGAGCEIPVIDNKGSEYHVSVEIEDILWLLEQGHITPDSVVMDKKALVFGKIYAFLTHSFVNEEDN